MNGQYILDNEGNPVEASDLMTWGAWMQTANRHVAKDTLAGDIMVSTVFLGLDHSFGHGQPLLYETMIFGGSNDQYQDRYSTRAQALEGHKKALEIAVGPTL